MQPRPMQYQELHKESLLRPKSSMPAVPSPAAFSYSITNQPWVSYKPSKFTPAQTSTCSNCRRMRNVLLFISILAIFSPILMSIRSPPPITMQPVVELTIHFMVYAAACFTVAGMAISYDILRKQLYCNMCAFCCLQAAATTIALRGMFCLHSAALPSSQTAGTVKFWAHCAHCILLRPAVWITGGNLDDFPLSEDARVQIWMLCMLSSALLGLGVGVGIVKATISTICRSTTSATIVGKTATASAVDNNNLDAFLIKFEGKIHCISLDSKGNSSTASAPTSVGIVDQCLIQHRSLSSIEAGFIIACSVSGFWLCLAIIGAFATAA